MRVVRTLPPIFIKSAGYAVLTARDGRDARPIGGRCEASTFQADIMTPARNRRNKINA